MVIHFVGKVAASANVKVRPKLANVSWWEALLANHFNDWAWYHYGNELATASVITGATLAVLIYGLYKKRW
jgi:hypothetical protein